VTNLWPEDESLASKLASVFDEALKVRKTGQQIEDELLEAAAALRAAGKPVPKTLERLEQRRAIEEFLKPQPPCSWLRDRRPLGPGGVEELVEHWRVCATCQAAARAQRQAHLTLYANPRGSTNGR